MNISKFDQYLLTASNDLKEFINSYTNHKEIFDLQERHDNMNVNTKKISFLKITSWTFSCSFLQQFPYWLQLS